MYTGRPARPPLLPSVAGRQAAREVIAPSMRLATATHGEMTPDP
jgi:hypothetical protein